jgi:hypothetical protein
MGRSTCAPSAWYPVGQYATRHEELFSNPKLDALSRTGVRAIVQACVIELATNFDSDSANILRRHAIRLGLSDAKEMRSLLESISFGGM